MLKSIIKTLLYSLALLIILSAVLLTGVRLYTPVLIEDKTKVEAFVSRLMDQPVKIDSVSVKWRGFIPMFTFHDVAILDDNAQSQILTVKQLVIDIDLLHSLIKRDLNHSVLIASGASLKLKIPDKTQQQDGGIAKELRFHQDILEWLITQRKLLLQDWQLTILLPENKIAKFKIKTLSLVNTDDRHQFIIDVYSVDAKQSIKVNADLYGSMLNFSDWSGDFDLQAKQVALPEWLQFFDNYGIYLSGGSNNLQLKGKVKQGNIHRVETQFSSKNVKLESKAANDSQHIDSAEGKLSWKTLSNGWELSISNIDLKVDDEEWPKNSFSLKFIEPQKGTIKKTVYLKHLSIHDLHEFVVAHHILPSEIIRFFENIKINGDLTNTYFSQTSTETTAGSWQVKSTFRNVKTKPWHNIPGLTNLSGTFVIDSEQGTIKLRSQKIDATFPKNGKPIPFDSLSGDFTWQVGSEFLKVVGNNIEAKNKHITLSALISLVIPDNSQSVQAKITGQYTIHNLHYIAEHFPLYFITNKQRSWLSKAITNAAKAAGEIEIIGDIANFPSVNKLDTFRIKSKIDHLNLDYLKKWPIAKDISAQLLINNHQLQLEISQADIAKAKIQKLTAKIDNIYADNAYIDIIAVMNANLPVDWEFLYQSEFKDQFQLLRRIDLRGKVRGKLTLKVPLYQPLNKTLVFGELGMKLSQFKMIGWDLQFNDINGVLFFTKNRVTADKITAKLFGEPANIDVKIVDNEDKTSFSTVTLTSIINQKILKEQFDIPFVSFINGRTLYKAQLKLDHDNSDHHVIDLKSALQSIEVNLPKPLGKSKSDKVDFSLNARFGSTDKKTEVNLDYGSRLNAKMVYDVNNGKTKLARATLWFGDKEAPTPKKSGIAIGGTINEFSLDEWTPYFSPQAIAGKPTTSTTDISKQISAIDLSIKKLNLFEQYFSSIKLQLKKVNSITRWQLSGRAIDGIIDVSIKPIDKISARLNRLFLNQVDSKDVPSDVNPRKLPVLDITVKDFRYKKLQLGAVTLTTNKIANGLRIEQFSSKTKQHDFNARGRWINRNNKPFTEFRGIIVSNAMTSFLKEWDILPFIQAKKGNFRFHVDWLAAPYNLSVNKMSGKLIIDFRDGKLINLGKTADQQIALGRLITLLSIRALPKRLFTGFSGIDAKGFKFDRFKAIFSLKRGIARTQQAYFTGIVANIYAKGHIDIPKETVNLLITIKPHITASLPIIATVTAGPIAGGATWAANRIAGPIFNSIAASRYQITGSWDKPRVFKVKSRKIK